MNTTPTQLPPDRRPRILVVDDEPVIRNVLRRALGRIYDVATATDAFAAERLLADAERPFDVVLCDIWMPWCTGPSFAERLRAGDRPAPRFVFMTGALPVLVHELVDEGSLVLNKPFAMADVYRLVDEALAAGPESGS